MQETVDSVLAKVEEHDKALQQKLSSSPSRTQTSNTAVPPATVVPPIVHPQYGIPAPVLPNHLCNPNAYFNPVVPPVPFVCPPPMVIGTPPYHPPTVHSSPINPSSTLPSTGHTSNDSSYHSLSRDVLPLSSLLHGSDETPLKEVVGVTQSSSLHVEVPPDHQKLLGLGNDGNSNPGGQHCGQRHDNHRGQTLFSEGRKDNQAYCKSRKTNVDNQSLKAMSVLERVKLLKQSMNTMQISIKESSEAFERNVDVILTKVEENERMLQMKYPWLQDMMSNTRVPLLTNPTRCPVDSHLKAIDDMNSSPMRVPIDPHSIPIKHMNSSPKTVPIGAHLNPRSSSSCDMSSSMDTMSTTTKLHISSSHKSSPCKRRMSIASVESPCNIKSSSTTKCKDRECFPRVPTKDGDLFSTLGTSHIKYNQLITQDSLHQQYPNKDVNASSPVCAACECECNANEKLFRIEDADDSDLHFQLNHIFTHDHTNRMNPDEVLSETIPNNLIHGYSGNIPDLEYDPYPTSLPNPIMSPHQSCMRFLSPKYVLCIPINRRKRFKIPNVSNKNDH